MVTAFVYQQERTARDEILVGTLREFTHRTRERINQFVALLTATSAFVGTSPEAGVSRERFVDYVAALGDLEALAGVQGIGLSLMAAPGDLPRLNERLSRDYGATPQAWRRENDDVRSRDVIPADSQEVASAIVLLAPEDSRNRLAIGYDMYSEKRRRWAMDRARETRRPSLSAPVILVQESGVERQVGTLIYVYFDGARGGEGEGFVYSPMRMGHLFDVLTEGADRVDLRVIDTEVPDQPLYMSRRLRDRGSAGLIPTTMTLEIGGRVWEMTSYTPPVLKGWLTRTPVAMLTGLASILLALSATAAVHGLSWAERQSRQLAEVQTRRLADQDLHLREMSHRLKNVLARVVAMARQAARHADTTEDFVTALTQRLQAMAVAQDLLTRSAVDGAEIRDLIVAEISQIYGEAREFATISGPRVILSPQQTQALGLSMHELATNALKYGAGAVMGARLQISWTLYRTDRGQEVRLLWEEETGLASTAPAHKGFGSKLLESCIRLELGGRLVQEYHESGLRVRISFPLDP